MAALATQVIVPSGLAPSYAAVAAGGDTVNPGQTVFLHVKNANASPCVVTVDDVNTPIPGGSASNPDLVVSVPASTGDRMIGPIDAGRFAQPGGATPGRANVTYSVSASVTIAVVQI